MTCIYSFIYLFFWIFVIYQILSINFHLNFGIFYYDQTNNLQTFINQNKKYDYFSLNAYLYIFSTVVKYLRMTNKYYTL